MRARRERERERGVVPERRLPSSFLWLTRHSGGVGADEERDDGDAGWW